MADNCVRFCFEPRRPDALGGWCLGCPESVAEVSSVLEGLRGAGASIQLAIAVGSGKFLASRVLLLKSGLPGGVQQLL